MIPFKVQTSDKLRDRVKKAYHETDYGIRKKMMSKVQNLVDGKPIQKWNEMESIIGINLNKFCRTRSGKVRYRIPLTLFNLHDPDAFRVAFYHKNITTQDSQGGVDEGVGLLEAICEEVGVDFEKILKGLRGDL